MNATTAGDKNKQRLAMSLFANGADMRTGHVSPCGSLPPLWTLRAIRGELPPELCEHFRNAHDRALTGGRDLTEDPPEVCM